MSLALRGFALCLLPLVVVGIVDQGCVRHEASQPSQPRPTAANAPAPSEGARQQASAANGLGFRLYGQLRPQAAKPNLFISPVSIHLALAMTYNGAAGGTAEAMAKTLGLAGRSLADVNAAAQELLAQLESSDPSEQLLLADSLWGDKRTTFLPEFIQANQANYSAEVSTVDFLEPKAAAARINAWTKDKTQGKIAEIVNERIVNGATMVLVNALYFKGRWSDPFDPAQTKDGPFHLADGTTKTVAMMERSGSMDYHETEDYQAVRLGYGDGTTRMVIFLPRAGKTPAGLIAKMTAESWSTLRGADWEGTGRLVLPRLKADYEQSLVEALTSLGMEVAFKFPDADFSKLADLRTVTEGGLFLSDVVHKCTLEVDEKGTEAAAATAVVAMAGGPPPPPKEFTMVVDRPFAFAIEHVPTGALLFIGTIGEPG